MLVQKNVSDLGNSWQDKECVQRAQEETGITLEFTEISQAAWAEQISVGRNLQQNGQSFLSSLFLGILHVKIIFKQNKRYYCKCSNTYFFLNTNTLLIT